MAEWKQIVSTEKIDLIMTHLAIEYGPLSMDKLPGWSSKFYK